MSREDRLREMVAQDGDWEFEESDEDRALRDYIGAWRRRLAVALTTRARMTARRKIEEALERLREASL